MMFMQSVKDVWLVNQNDELKSCVHPPAGGRHGLFRLKTFFDSPEKTIPTASGGWDTVVVKKYEALRKIVAEGIWYLYLSPPEVCYLPGMTGLCFSANEKWF